MSKFLEVIKSDITITTKDGFALAATHFSNKKYLQSSRNTVVIASALGVPRYIYFKLARFLAQHDFFVLTFDYRGIHDSQSNKYSNFQMQMGDWGRYDIDAVLKWSLEKENPNKLLYLGHSCGGQILGLAPSARHIHKAVFIASQSGYWKLWPKPQRWAIRTFWNIIPLLTPWFDQFPARMLGLSSVNIPSGVAQEWSEWGKSEDYFWDFLTSKEQNQYTSLAFPLLSIGFSDDRFLGPPNAVRKLLSYYPNTQTDLRIATPSQYDRKSIGHFGFLNNEFQNTLWSDIVNWLACE